MCDLYVSDEPRLCESKAEFENPTFWSRREVMEGGNLGGYTCRLRLQMLNTSRATRI